MLGEVSLVYPEGGQTRWHGDRAQSKRVVLQTICMSVLSAAHGQLKDRKLVL